MTIPRQASARDDLRSELLDRVSDEPLVRNRTLPHSATRHMCVGCYVDHEYRERAVCDVYLARSRQVAPSYGYDLIPVLVHARRAAWIDHAQHVLVVVAIAYWIYHDLFAAAITISAVIDWYVIKRFWRLLKDFMSYIRTRGSLAERAHLRRRFRWLTAGLIAPWFFVIGVAFYFARRILDQHFAHLRVVGLEVLLTLGSLIAIVSVAAVVRQICIDRIPANPQQERIYRARLERIRRDQYRPITVFSGYRPFVGSGVEVRTWSFAQRLRRVGEAPEDQADLAVDHPPDPLPEDLGEPPFRTVVLVDHIREQMSKLVRDTDTELALPHLRVYDAAFVGGYRTGKLTAGRTQDQIDNGTADAIAINSLLDNASDRDRHYIVCQVTAWDGEIVASMFIHVGIQGRALYLELTSWALPQTRDAFLVGDLRRGSGLPAYWRAFRRSALRMPTELARAPGGLARLAKRPLYLLMPSFERTRDTKRDVGASFSLRELAANVHTDPKGYVERPPTMSYFQWRDVVKFHQVIERRLLSSVQEFLESRDIDTAEYRERAVALFNTGIVQFGSGTISVQNLATSTSDVDNAIRAAMAEQI